MADDLLQAGVVEGEATASAAKSAAVRPYTLPISVTPSPAIAAGPPIDSAGRRGDPGPALVSRDLEVEQAGGVQAEDVALGVLVEERQVEEDARQVEVPVRPVGGVDELGVGLDRRHRRLQEVEVVHLHRLRGEVHLADVLARRRLSSGASEVRLRYSWSRRCIRNETDARPLSTQMTLSLGNCLGNPLISQLVRWTMLQCTNEIACIERKRFIVFIHSSSHVGPAWKARGRPVSSIAARLHELVVVDRVVADARDQEAAHAGVAGELADHLGTHISGSFSGR